jgi:hypothetical protein
MRLYVVVEGQTEEAFVKQVLAPHLASFSVWADADHRHDAPRPVNGRQTSRRWCIGKHWREDLNMPVPACTTAMDVRFTTLFDLYGLPR